MNRQSKPPPGAAHRRVMVTVDAQSCLPPTIELAVALAAATESALHGLFVEDLDLLSVAKLPFSQEVPLPGGRPRALDNLQLQRSLDKFARQFRQSLEHQAGLLALSCSHSVVQGRKQSMELGEAGRAEFIILGQPSRGNVRASGPRRILLLADQGPLLLPALEAVLDKSRGLRTELLILAGPGQSSQTDLSVVADLSDRYPDVVPVILPLAQLRQILKARSPVIVCVITARRLEHGELGQILSLATCPVIVAGG